MKGSGRCGKAEGKKRGMNGGGCQGSCAIAAGDPGTGGVGLGPLAVPGRWGGRFSIVAQSKR